MIGHQKNNLAAKIALAIGLSVSVPSPVNAGIPVIDGVGLVQHILNALQNIQQTMQMIQSYQTQLMQLQNQIKNTMNPSAFLWDDADNIIQDLLSQVDTINHYKNQFGSVDNYIGKFKDLETYRSAPCLSSGCTPTEMMVFQQQVQQQQVFNSEAVKKTNDAMIKGLDKQQEQLETDANRLRDLQANAQSAQGHLEAIQHANQLASAQANQLLQIRGLLISQQSAISVSAQAQEDDKALRKAASLKARESRYATTPYGEVTIR